MVSTGEIQEYLHGMSYPAGKNDLVSKAQSNNAPQDVIDMLNRLPDQRFSNPIDVNKAIGDIE
jgi:hypothetical protein